MTKMNESDFNQLVDETLIKIEDVIENSEHEIDFDTIAGILTLEFNDESKIIINRQSSNSQLWVAARSGGYHLDYIDGQWFCNKESCTLGALLNRLCSEQDGNTIKLGL